MKSLESWKEVAAYLKRNVRTARRWEKGEGLPVHRHPPKQRATVYAFRTEIDDWRSKHGQRRACLNCNSKFITVRRRGKVYCSLECQRKASDKRHARRRRRARRLLTACLLFVASLIPTPVQAQTPEQSCLVIVSASPLIVPPGLTPQELCKAVVAVLTQSWMNAAKLEATILIVNELALRMADAEAAIAALQGQPPPPSDPPPDPDPPPPPPPPSGAVLDDFERHSLGSNWTVLSGNVEIVNNSDLGLRSKAGLGLVVWNATTFSPDQFGEIVISPDIHPLLLQQIFVRRRMIDSQRYGFHWQIGKPDCDGGWVLKLDGGAGAPVLNCVLAPKPAPGDTMRIEVQGSTLRGFHNGALVITATDSVLAGPGQPGIAINSGLLNVPPGDFPVSASESWNGGEL